MEVSKERQRHAQFGRKQTVELNNDRAEVSDISSRMLSWKQKHKQDNLERYSEHLLPWLKYIKQKHNPSQAEKCMHQSRRGGGSVVQSGWMLHTYINQDIFILIGCARTETAD